MSPLPSKIAAGARLVALGLVVPCGVPDVARATPPRAHVDATLSLRVTDPEAAADRLVAAAADEGGYFLRRDAGQLTLAVPAERLAALVAQAERTGTVLERGLESHPLTRELEHARAGLETRESMLGDYQAVLADADVAALPVVEQEIVSLVEEIEGLRGTLDLAEHRAAYASLAVRFRFRDRTPPARTRPSSFPWIQRLDVVSLLEDFHAP